MSALDCVTVGDDSFKTASDVVLKGGGVLDVLWIDLKTLKTITLGYHVFEGHPNNSNRLSMIGTNHETV